MRYCYGNRGRETEDLINMTNDFYNRKDAGVISKIPVPVRVLKLSGNKIVEGYYEEKCRNIK